MFYKMEFFNNHIKIENQQVKLPILEEKGVELWIKREDLIHKDVSGNKFRKLKYNVQGAKNQQKDTLLTFGGAFSNHIVATAVAGNLLGLKTIGVIRGDELKNRFDEIIKENDTLRVAYENGMKFEFVTREAYRKKTETAFIEQLKNKFGDFYLVPEGGTNSFAIKGCEEILIPEDEKFNYICSAVGTGGTISGIINSVKMHQKVIGFPALKGDFLFDEIKKYTNSDNWSLNLDYNFGGYAKFNSDLIRFINWFYKQTNIPLDPVYTGKMIFGILDLVEKDYFKKRTKILAIHTGGLQGILGFNKKLQNKNLEEIKI